MTSPSQRRSIVAMESSNLIDPNDRDHPSYRDVHRGRANLLSPGDPLPSFELRFTSGDTLSVPDAITGDYAVLLFYRGHW
ncbi:MAG: hypothetical protein AAF648_03660 [Pseudomonadota bacterium]